MVKFADEPPKVTVDWPSCILLSVVEVQFQVGLMPALESKNEEDVLERYKRISVDNCSSTLTSTEMDEWQPEQITQGMLNILGQEKKETAALA